MSLVLPASPATVKAPVSPSVSIRMKRNFYVIVSVAAALITVGGFSMTYLIPMVAGVYQAPSLVVHLHAALFFGWIALFVVQSVLIRTRRIVPHRRLGVVGAFLAAGMVVVGTYVSLASAARGTPRALPPDAFLLIPLTDMLLFSVFVTLAVWNRKRALLHKSLIVLGTSALLFAPFGRLGRPFFLFGPVVFILLIMLAERILRGRISIVYLWGGAVFVVVHFGRLWLSETPAWLWVADHLIALM